MVDSAILEPSTLLSRMAAPLYAYQLCYISALSSHLFKYMTYALYFDFSYSNRYIVTVQNNLKIYTCLVLWSLYTRKVRKKKPSLQMTTRLFVEQCKLIEEFASSWGSYLHRGQPATEVHALGTKL